MMKEYFRSLFVLLMVSTSFAYAGNGQEVELPKPGTISIDKVRGEVIATGEVQFPKGKPCINEYGQRVQAFVGCSKAAGGDAKMAGYFVFLVDVPTETVYQGMLKLGAKPRVHYSMQAGHQKSGLSPKTKPENYLQGDPVLLSIFWKEKGRIVERPYQDFVTERILVDGKPTDKPWTPHFVFHGSGAIHKSGTGCIACPCDCAGGIIADNRFPLYDPKPIVRFDMGKAPAVGSRFYVRIRPLITRK